MQSLEIVPPNSPSDPLVDIERELAGLVAEYGILKKAYPKETKADALADVAQASVSRQEKLPTESLGRMRMLWSFLRMWMEWGYAWERWPEFHDA